ncbi:hypothetical protein BDD39_001203 [Saccharococcus thermophilus]|uniref:Uncharacterized protein n=1 Tax=Saccharococcus thermophilus TaxID=29396 RepID=A0A846MG72_9BACL|nr:hypothetical protein [Saccharococcus thermophilus]
MELLISAPINSRSKSKKELGKRYKKTFQALFYLRPVIQQMHPFVEQTPIPMIQNSTHYVYSDTSLLFSLIFSRNRTICQPPKPFEFVIQGL